ncbi:sigma-70 family RNA polymerase sigma factor [Caulobacter sp. S45]|uniref:sigma-70 family RNA polymerase sigma factor n=1 Tax=Caulobacter sp. S45 TaxID=1641861 RepID=UPI00131DD255|nr:sigma-70 family RNA polymerase sigma factor [Caulobacter sp. S45]
MDGETDRQRLSLALVQVGGGDKAALRRVYDQTSAKLFGVCLRILRDRNEAEDVLQEVYVTVWRRAGSFDPERGVSPITWLATLARNRAIDRLRASKAHLSRPLELAAEAPDPAPLASASLERDEAHRRLAVCLGELEPEHAAYIRGAFFDGHTYASLADAAGAPLGTMKSWIRRALLRLRTCLDQ